MQAVCRERFFELPVALFRLFSCSMCYKYLFHTGNELQPHSQQPWTLVPTKDSDNYSQNFSVIADVSNVTSRDLICNSLIGDDCKRWTDCCYAAISCCQKQLATAKRNLSESAFCPRTWDGYGCFGDTDSDTRTYISCPSYIEHADTSEMAYKDCTENGTWWINPSTGSEWTNYTTCVQKENHEVIIYVTLACNIVSLVMLIPACIIFLSIRQLRVQKRIKLHICLFLSFVLTCVVIILWDFIVYLDRLQNEIHNTIMHRNSSGCKFLYILTRYASTTTFFWMVCEGFYLHRLIVHAFATPKSLTFYYIFGWIVSWVPATIYSIIRATNGVFDKNCWVHNIGVYEWLMYAPNLLCIAVNVIFLGNIIRILCTKLQAHPNEPSNYRKALKATFVLVPLFGIQQFVVIYRPQTGTKVDFIYEIIQSVIINTQGAIVSLIFCFLNGEVHTYLRNCIGRHMTLGSSAKFNRKSSMSSATQFTSVASGRRTTKQYENSDTGYIPLSTSSTANDMSNATKPSNGHVTFSV
ncbi:calcitonin gene-related peptide type 1 receptor-like isoform X3 [Mercenaria mercenaria]|uniref:calcitonin gene-related peptide type 1 receptor-like isoform X3 n=1 Tax=Mercenaria mercenaria TaxID=6596 RepID=UPI00234EC05C|nr:calcitonin gene-related peptide type 1 receptor-like isoform X3 [Mercenaria mercenaria]